MKPKSHARIRERDAVERSESEPGASENASTGKIYSPSNSGNLKSESQRHFQRRVSTNCQGRDEIELGINDCVVIDPHERHAPSRRSDKQLAAVLALLDELDTGKEETR